MTIGRPRTSTKKPNTVCSIVRNDLRITGNTRHSGSDYYELAHKLEPHELVCKLSQLIDKWNNAGKLEQHIINETSVVAVFNSDTTASGNYRTVKAFADGQLVVSE